MEEEEETTKGEEEEHPPPSILVFTACVFPLQEKRRRKGVLFIRVCGQRGKGKRKSPFIFRPAAAAAAAAAAVGKIPEERGRKMKFSRRTFQIERSGGDVYSASSPPPPPPQAQTTSRKWGKEEGDRGRNYQGIEREGKLFLTELYVAHVLTGTRISLQEDDYNNFD